MSPTKIVSIMLSAVLLSCGGSTTEKEENCDLDAHYTFNFEQAQYYGLPNIEFAFDLTYDWQVRMPTFAKQNIYYYEAARVNDANSGSLLLRVMPFKRQGSYITVSEQAEAQIYRSMMLAVRESWVTESQDTLGAWWVKYGRYEQEPWDFVIAHKLVTRDTAENSVLLELQMQCPADSFSLKREECLDDVINSFKVYL